MKRITPKQRRDLDCIKWFIPKDLLKVEISQKDELDFLDFSDNGITPQVKTPGYTALMEGKRWRGIHVHEMYEQGILEGSVPYMILLEDMPRIVVDFLKKEMFKGHDEGIIEACFAELNGTPMALTNYILGRRIDNS